jgi:carboxymethylenebutenolidase
MSDFINLTAEDGHTLSAYVAGEKQSTAALIIIQEIFGVNTHIRSVADSYAADGFFTVAPALFDRIQARTELDYSPASIELGRGLATRLEPELVLNDIAAAVTYARSQTTSGKVGVVGYCLGGTYAWLSAAGLKIDAAVGYYGGKIVQLLDQKPLAPLILHFGKEDRGIPLTDVQKIEHAHPEIPIFLYEAGHAFNRDGGQNYSQAAAELARARSLKFLREHLEPGN